MNDVYIEEFLSDTALKHVINQALTRKASFNNNLSSVLKDCRNRNIIFIVNYSNDLGNQIEKIERKLQEKFARTNTSI